MILDDAYRLTYVNDEVCRISGYPREEIIGQDFRKFLDEESKQLVAERYIRRQRGEEVSPRYEFNIVRKDGQKRRVEISSNVIKDSAGKVKTVAQILDITERKRMEETLRESEEKYKTIFENVSDVIVHLNRYGKVINVNKRAEDHFGYKPEELIGKNFAKLGVLSLKDFPKMVKLFGEAVKGKPLPLIEVESKRKDGSTVLLEVTTTLVKKDGKIEGTVAIIRDITERKRMEQEIQEKNGQLIRSERLAAIGQLAGGVGHELRNPLSAIKNAVYYIKGKVATSELGQREPRVMEFLGIIDDEINSSSKIITDLLGFSRVGKPSVSPARIEKIIEDALSRTPIPQSIKLIKKLDTYLPEINVDPDQIKQVLVNIITNAVEAMPEGGRLLIAAREKDKFLEVGVSDTGCGIPQESIDKIFDPLFTTKAKGIGLGLPVCKAIIDRHEGGIAVESKVGEGTTFNIRLPLGRNIGGN
jgi:PAS domain S-box-containing protein